MSINSQEAFNLHKAGGTVVQSVGSGTNTQRQESLLYPTGEIPLP
jgi:hypothetical protein